MKLSLITAIAENNVIGSTKNTANGLPWSLPDELDHFRTITKQKPVIMGRKTHEAIGGLLPERQNIILSRNPEFTVHGADVCHSLQQAVNVVNGDVAFIIGGGEVYQHAISSGVVNRLYITNVHAKMEGDVFIPEINLADWEEVESTFHAADARHAQSFTMNEYRRKANS